MWGIIIKVLCIPWWLIWLKNPPACGRLGFDPWVGKIPWRREMLPTAVFCLRSSMDCIVHAVARSWTRLDDFHFHFSPETEGMIVIQPQSEASPKSWNDREHILVRLLHSFLYRNTVRWLNIIQKYFILSFICIILTLLCKKLKFVYHKEVNNYSGPSRCLHVSI